MTTTPSTSLALPNMIARYALQSLVDVLSDGTRTFYIQKFSIRFLDLDALEAISTNVRDLKHGVAYSGSGEDYDWSIVITYNANGAGWGKFSLNDYSDVVKPQEMVEEPTQDYIQIFELWTSIPGGGYSLRKDVNFKTVEIAPKNSGTRYEELLAEANAKGLDGHYSQSHGLLRSWGWYETTDKDQLQSVNWWVE